MGNSTHTRVCEGGQWWACSMQRLPPATCNDDTDSPSMKSQLQKITLGAMLAMAWDRHAKKPSRCIKDTLENGQEPTLANPAAALKV